MRPPLQRPPAHFAGLTDLDLEQKMAVGQVFDLLRGVPAGLRNVLAHRRVESDAHALELLADEDAKTVAMALAKVVGHQGCGDAHPKGGDTLDTIDAKHFDLPLGDNAGIEVQGPAFEEDLIRVDDPGVWASSAIMHDTYTMVLLAGAPEVVQDGRVAAKTFLQHDIVE
jgi:hypothetical protein